jgi:phosphoglycerate dehydrogenase-like enzyme
MTPHNAFNTAEGVERKSKQSVEQVVQFLEKGMFAWPVPEE